jgi:hypothetical protein
MVAPLGYRWFISSKVHQTFRHRGERPTIFFVRPAAPASSSRPPPLKRRAQQRARSARRAAASAVTLPEVSTALRWPTRSGRRLSPVPAITPCGCIPSVQLEDLNSLGSLAQSRSNVIANARPRKFTITFIAPAQPRIRALRFGTRFGTEQLSSNIDGHGRPHRCGFFLGQAAARLSQ